MAASETEGKKSFVNELDIDFILYGEGDPVYYNASFPLDDAKWLPAIVTEIKGEVGKQRKKERNLSIVLLALCS